MTAANPRKPLFRRVQIFLAQARFFTLSALLHLILVVAGGSVVLFQRYVAPPDDFVAGEGSLIPTETDAQKPDELPASPQVNLPAPASPNSAPSMAALTVTGTTTAFALNTAPAARFDGKIAEMGDGGKALGAKLASLGAGAGGGMKGGTMRFFGMTEKTTPALVGTFYDLKQTRGRKPTGISPDEYHQVFRRFVAQGWRESVLHDYFKAPQPLYSTQIMIPNMKADEGPKAFGLEKEVQPSRWLVHYKGKVSPPEDGVYHFVGAGGGDELERVVAVASADHDQRVTLGDELAQGVLTVLGRLADGVGKAHLTLRPRPPQRFDQRQHFVQRLCRLRNHPVTSALRERGEMRDFFDDMSAGKVADESFHFDVAGLADDHRKVTKRNELPKLTMRTPHQRTRPIGHVKTSAPPRRSRGVRSTMRRDHDLGSRRAGEITETAFQHPTKSEAVPDDGVVDELAEDGELAVFSETVRLGDGVADAETESVVFCQLDFHD